MHVSVIAGVAYALVLVAAVYLATDLMRLFSRENKFNVDGQTVLITGGSQGMGRAVAKLLAQKGANVVIVARDKTKLDKAVEYIKAAAKSPSQRFLAIAADMTVATEATSILPQTTAWNHGQVPDIVWAIAGSAHPSFFAELDLPILRAQMDINYWAAAYLAHAALRLFLKPDDASPAEQQQQQQQQQQQRAARQQPRHIIMTSSVVVFASLAGYSPYAPAKAAMRSLADALRQETLLYNAARRRRQQRPGKDSDEAPPPSRDISIHLVVPGTITSPGFESEEKVKHPVTRALEESDPKQTEDEVAAAAVAGLERGRFIVTTSWLGWLMSGASLANSPRQNKVADTLLAWAASIVWLFVGPDLDGKVEKHGLTYGVGRGP